METDQDLESFLTQLLANLSDATSADLADETLPDWFDEDELRHLQGAYVRTFANASLMTSDSGVVLQLKNGAEFQLRIIRSR